MAYLPIKLGAAVIPSTWTQLPGARPEKHSNGLDVLIRKYLVPTVPEAVKLPPIGSSDREGFYPQMYLVDAIPTGVEGQCSEVELTYMGTRDGSLPADRTNPNVIEQQARYTSFPSGKTSVEITYQSPVTTTIKWFRSQPSIASIGGITPANATVVWFVGTTSEGSPLPADEAGALGFFVQRISTTGEAEEVVSGRYWRATIIKQALLFSAVA